MQNTEITATNGANVRTQFTIEVSQTQKVNLKRSNGQIDIAYIPVHFQRLFTVGNEDLQRANGNDYVIGTGIRAMNEYLCARKVANEHKAGLKMLKSNVRTHFTIKGENFEIDSKQIEELIGGESLFYSANKRLQLKFGATVYFGLCIAKMNELQNSRFAETLHEVNDEIRKELDIVSAERKAIKSAAMLQLETAIEEKAQNS